MAESQTPIRLPRKEDMPVSSDSLIRWLLFFCKPYNHVIVPFVLYRLFRFTVMALVPLVIGIIINAFGTGEIRADPLPYIGLMVGYFGIYAVLLSTLQVFYYEANAFEKISRAMTLFGMDHITGLPLEWHEREGSGGKLQRIMTARNSFSDLERNFRWVMMPIAGGLVGVTISVITLNAPWFYFLMYMGFAASYVGASWWMGRPVIKLYDRYNQTFEKLLSGVYEFVSSIRTVKALALEDYISTRAHMLEGQGHTAYKGVMARVFLRWTVLNTLCAFWLCLFAGIGFLGAYEGWLTPGAFAATFFLAFNLWLAVDSLAAIQDQIYACASGLRRFIATLKETPAPLDIPPLRPVPANWEAIRLDALSFTYKGKEEQGVHDISLTVRRGEKIAFVGASGAGKSTLAKLLMKQMLPQSGTITVGGVDLRHLPSSDWLVRIGFVPQEVELFDLSIRDNILLDRQGVSEESYRAAIDNAALNDFVKSLPEGDETLVGERGIRLSGGQRQRLGIARALVRDAEVLVFDEATSSLDSLSEQHIQDAMERSFKGRTVFLIAHRLSTVRHVDRIVVLDRGRIVEEGPFDTLVSKGGVFSRMWALQSG